MVVEQGQAGLPNSRAWDSRIVKSIRWIWKGLSACKVTAKKPSLSLTTQSSSEQTPPQSPCLGLLRGLGVCTPHRQMLTVRNQSGHQPGCLPVSLWSLSSARVETPLGLTNAESPTPSISPGTLSALVPGPVCSRTGCPMSFSGDAALPIRPDPFSGPSKLPAVANPHPALECGVNASAKQ